MTDKKSQLNHSELFPKKLSYLALVISFGVLASQTLLIQKSVEDYRDIHMNQIPTLEMTAINIRLNGSIHTQLDKMIHGDKANYESNYETYTLQLDALNGNILELRENIKTFATLDNINRDALNEIETMIISSIINGEGDKASEIYKSDKYLELYFSFTENTQLFTEDLAYRRDDVIKEKENAYTISVVGSIIFFVVIFAIWLRVYWVFNKNAKRQAVLEDELEEQQAMSFSTAKLASLGEMAAGIAHEINNPLTIIIGASMAIKRVLSRAEYENPQVEKYLTNINKTTNRIASIIRSLRNISRDGSNDEFENTNMVSLLEESKVLMSERLNMGNINFSIENNADSTDISARGTEISQVLINLINNAVDALEEHTDVTNRKICVKLISNSTQLEIYISDTGPGIPESKKEKIFNPFFTTKDIGKGTGIGLSLSKTIIENHHGSLSLDEENELSTFLIKLPLYSSTEDKAAA